MEDGNPPLKSPARSESERVLMLTSGLTEPSAV
jgi:hypothetical protein